MKFRMAENSLFAVLLRSRWWISLLIAIGFVGVVSALLPPEYRLVASMGAFPFIVIAGMAFWKQRGAPSEDEVRTLLEGAARMGWPEFEQKLRAGFARQGWQVQAGQGGADFVLERGSHGTRLVSARRWKAARHGEDAVQALDKAMQAQDVSHGVYVALGDLSPQAAKLAKARQIEVLQGATLARLLRG